MKLLCKQVSFKSEGNGGGNEGIEVPNINAFRITNIGSTDVTVGFRLELLGDTFPDFGFLYRYDENDKFIRWNEDYDNGWDKYFEVLTVEPGKYIEIIGDGESSNVCRENNWFEIPDGQVSLSGNIMSLVYGPNLNDENQLIIPQDYYLFAGIFTNCKGVVDAFDLLMPATTLKEGCYWSLFCGCSNLKSIKCLSKNIDEKYFDLYWVYGVASEGTIYIHPDATWPSKLLPVGWTVEKYYESMTVYAVEDSELEWEVENNQWVVREYSYDRKNWTVIPSLRFVSLPISKGSKLYIRGKTNSGYWHDPYGESDDEYQQIYVYGNVILSGNIKCLSNYADLSADLGKNCIYYNVFKGGIYDIKDVIIPDKVDIGSFWKTFSRLPITTAPELPAKELIHGSYYSLGANSLYNLLAGCYEEMFKNCSNLNYVKCLAENPDEKYTRNWLQGVSPTGTFVKKRGVEWPRGDSGIPEGWEIIEVDE